MRSFPGRLLVLAAAAGIVGFGCAGLHPPGEIIAEGAAERASTVVISVEEVPAEDAWRAWYTLGAPARGVEFLSASSPFRNERWGVGVAGGEPGWRLDGGRERLCFPRRAQSFSVSFRTWTEPPPEGRALNLAFGERARLLYTGHLLVRPIASCDGEPAAAAPSPASSPSEPEPGFRFTFQTGEERTVRVAGRAAARELTWEPTPGEAATYVFFGDLEPAEGDGATAIRDPALPAWLHGAMTAAVPRLVERLAAETATPLPAPPLVLVDRRDAASDGASLSVAGLPGLLLVSVRGMGWEEETPETRRAWLLPIAREVFHLWDAALYPPDPESGWLSEAAAVHFAGAAAVAFGIEDAAEARRRLIAPANDCLVRLGSAGLLAALEAEPDLGGSGSGQSGSEEGPALETGLGVSCGVVALAAAEGALRLGVPPSDLGELFRRLFEHAAATGSYGSAALLGGLRELGAEPGAASDLRRMLRGEVTAADRLVQRLLEHAGVATELVPPDEATAGPETLREAVRRAVGRCYCGTGEAASCEPAVTGRELGAVAGEPLAGDPLAAWGRLRSAVARGGSLEVELAGEEVTLFCPQDTFDPTWSSLLRLAEPPPERDEPQEAE